MAELPRSAIQRRQTRPPKSTARSAAPASRPGHPAPGRTRHRLLHRRCACPCRQRTPAPDLRPERRVAGPQSTAPGTPPPRCTGQAWKAARHQALAKRHLTTAMESRLSSCLLLRLSYAPTKGQETAFARQAHGGLAVRPAGYRIVPGSARDRSADCATPAKLSRAPAFRPKELASPPSGPIVRPLSGFARAIRQVCAR